MEGLKFNDVRVTQSQFAGVCHSLRDIPYADNNEVYLENGVWKGTINCFGMIFLAAKIVGLVDWEFDMNLSAGNFGGAPRGKTLVGVLSTNFDKIASPGQEGQLERADLLMFRWADVNHRQRTIHHVGMHLGHMGNDEPYGTFIQALDRRSGGLDKIQVTTINPTDLGRIEEGWRLKGIVRD